MIGPLLGLIYLLTFQILNVHCLVSDDGLMSMIWCKHGFEWFRFWWTVCTFL